MKNRPLNVVTGGAGFVGSHLVENLVLRNEEVLVIDNLSSGRIKNLGSVLSSGKVTFIYLDLAERAGSLQDVIARATDKPVSKVFHLASPASPLDYGGHPWETLAVNSIGTMAAIELALCHNATFVYTSTSEIYGDPLVHPQPETYSGNVDPIGPRSCYDEGKRFGEAAVAAAVRTRHLDARIARLFNCYGPRMQETDGRLIPSLFDAALSGDPLPIHGTGLQTRSMTYVLDAVEMILLLANEKATDLAPVNVGNDQELSVLEIARAVADVVGVPFKVELLPARAGDPQRRKPDLRRALEFGWTPKTPLHQGLAETFNWLYGAKLAYA